MITNLLEIFFFILSYDIWFYISHILLHYIPFLEKIHLIHHNPYYKKMTFRDTYVGHYFETIFQSIGFFFPLFFFKFNFYSFIFSIIFVNIRGMIRHDYNYTWLIGNHHIIHHKYYNYNFGEYWLDYIFNTNYKKNEI